MLEYNHNYKYKVFFLVFCQKKNIALIAIIAKSISLLIVYICIFIIYCASNSRHLGPHLFSFCVHISNNGCVISHCNDHTNAFPRFSEVSNNVYLSQIEFRREHLTL